MGTMPAADLAEGAQEEICAKRQFQQTELARLEQRLSQEDSRGEPDDPMEEEAGAQAGAKAARTADQTAAPGQPEAKKPNVAAGIEDMQCP